MQLCKEYLPSIYGVYQVYKINTNSPTFIFHRNYNIWSKSGNEIMWTVPMK